MTIVRGVEGKAVDHFNELTSHFLSRVNTNPRHICIKSDVRYLDIEKQSCREFWSRRPINVYHREVDFKNYGRYCFVLILPKKIPLSLLGIFQLMPWSKGKNLSLSVCMSCMPMVRALIQTSALNGGKLHALAVFLLEKENQITIDLDSGRNKQRAG
jgi:hypothetical protein